MSVHAGALACVTSGLTTRHTPGWKHRMGPGGRRSRTPARRLRACNRACMDAARRRGFRAREVGTGVAPIMIPMRTAFLALLLVPPAGLAWASPVDDICAAPGVSQANKPCACTLAPNLVSGESHGDPHAALDPRLRQPHAALTPGATARRRDRGHADDHRRRGGSPGHLAGSRAARASGGNHHRHARPATSTSAECGNRSRASTVAGRPPSPSGRRRATSDLEATRRQHARGRRVRRRRITSPPGASAVGAVTMDGMPWRLGSPSEIDLGGKGDGWPAAYAPDRFRLEPDRGRRTSTRQRRDNFGGGEIDLSADGNVDSSANDRSAGHAGTAAMAASLDIEPVGGSVTLGGSIRLSAATATVTPAARRRARPSTPSGSITAHGTRRRQLGHGRRRRHDRLRAPVSTSRRRAPIQVQGKGADGDGRHRRPSRRTAPHPRRHRRHGADVGNGGRDRRHRLVLAQPAGGQDDRQPATAASTRWRAAAP